MSHIIESSEWIHKDCVFIDHFILENNEIKKKSSPIKQSHSIYADFPLISSFLFEVKINNSFYASIRFGIADRKLKDTRMWSRNYICYTMHGGIIEDGKHMRSLNKLKRDDVVTVFGNTRTGVIGFKVNGQNEEIYRSPKLLNNDIQWVPYIQLQNGDEVSILQSVNQTPEEITYFLQSMFNWDEDLVREILLKLCQTSMKTL